MAGVKGKSGGARPGAGRKAQEPTFIAPDPAVVESGDPLDPRPTLELIALGRLEVSALQMKALLALLPYTNTKKGEGGKKDDAAGRQKAAAGGQFGVRKGPRLVASR